MNAEKELQKLENEIKALKTAYEKMALLMPVFTSSVNFATEANRITATWSSGYTYEFDGNERVLVTYDTNTGANTLATLEMTTDGIAVDLKTQRVPYSGGARWLIYSMPNYDSNGNRIATNYTFTVHAAVEGTLGAKMIWQ